MVHGGAYQHGVGVARRWGAEIDLGLRNASRVCRRCRAWETTFRCVCMPSRVRRCSDDFAAPVFDGAFSKNPPHVLRAPCGNQGGRGESYHPY